MQQLIDGLDGENWLDCSNELLKFLKRKFQGNRGVIRAVKDIYEEDRLNALAKNKMIFLQNTDVENLDERINIFTKEILKINNIPDSKIRFELPNFIISKSEFQYTHPECFHISKLLLNEDLSGNAKLRLNAIFFSIICESLKQGKNTNAGKAGEDFNKIIFDLVGLEEGIDYKGQHRSSEGSDTDFVFPFVEDFDDLRVEIFMEVQFSTNDRIRLADSGLKQGAKAYLVTGNGLDACSLTLEKIGWQNCEKCRRRNIQLVCYSHEIKKELLRLEELIQKGTNPRENSIKKEFIKTAINFSELAMRLKRRKIK